MILLKSMKLLHLLEKEDYATFIADLQKLTSEEEIGVVSDLLTLVGGTITSSASNEMERAMEAVACMSTTETRVSTLINLAIYSKYDNLTRIVLEALTRDFNQLSQQEQEVIRWDIVVKVDREMMKELDEEEEETMSGTTSCIDNRLKLWISFCDFIKSTYCMRGSLITRCYRSSPSVFVEYLSCIDPLSPIVVSQSKQPFIYSSSYAVAQLADGLINFLYRKWTLKRRSYVDIIVTSMAFMSGMVRNEGTSINLPQMERLLVALLPTLNDYNMGNERKRTVSAFQSLILSFPRNHQPLLLKRLIRLIKDQVVKVDAEAQILSFFVDLYRQQLVVRGQIDNDYSSCLAELWAVVFIKYDDCSQASMFYQSLFLLAGVQARMSYRLPLLKDIQVRVLTPLQQQLSDYLQLRKLQEKTNDHKGNMDLSFLPTVEDDSLVRLNISLRVMKETFHHIHEALIKWK